MMFKVTIVNHYPTAKVGNFIETTKLFKKILRANLIKRRLLEHCATVERQGCHACIAKAAASDRILARIQSIPARILSCCAALAVRLRTKSPLFRLNWRTDELTNRIVPSSF